MKFARKIVLALVVVPVLIVLVSFLLPANYRVERSIEMNTKPEVVFAQINSLKHWPEWTAWTVVKYSDMKISFSGPESGVGATYAWTGKTSGTGTLTITAAEAPKSVGYTLDFENGKHVSTGALAIEPRGTNVLVRWHNAGDLGANPVNRIFGLLMDRMMGPDFEEGLRKLKQRVETAPSSS